MISRDVVSTFLEHFKYLNKDGKRNGFQLFNNKALTKANEGYAKDLEKALNIIWNDESKTEETKCTDIADCIKSTYDQCRQSREDSTPWKQHAKYYSAKIGDIKAGTIKYEYKTPYKPSKFEKNLLAGLEAVITLLNKYITPSTDIKYSENQKIHNARQKKLALMLKKNCCASVHDITHFTPERIIKNWRIL